MKKKIHFHPRKSDGNLVDVFIDLVDVFIDLKTIYRGLENKLLSEGREVNGEFRLHGT